MSELQFSLEYYSGILKAGLPAHVGGSGVVTFSPYLSLCPPYERSLCRQTLLSIAVHSLLHLFMSEGLVAIISSFESRSLSSFNFADPFLLRFFFPCVIFHPLFLACHKDIQLVPEHPYLSAGFFLLDLSLSRP